jgi:1-acyl-sn-glycerol-3-phosphate acyltransferase
MPDAAPQTANASPARTDPGGGAVFIPARHTPWFQRGFVKYTRKLIAKKFFAVRVAHDTIDATRDLDAHPAPVLMLMSHASWWDPLIGLYLSATYMPSRRAYSPMSAAELRKFGFFRRVGVFGIDPDSPESMRAMGDYVASEFAAHPRSTLWITPQGRFVDPRAPIEVRPGAAAIAARTPGIRVVCVAVEYGFWTDQRPEVFIRFEPCALEEGRSGLTGWQRAIPGVMERNRDALARLVMARDPAGFASISGGATKINPIMDLILRARGQNAALDAQRRGR